MLNSGDSSFHYENSWFLHHHSKEFVKKGKERVDYDFYAFLEGVERETHIVHNIIFDKKDRQDLPLFF